AHRRAQPLNRSPAAAAGARARPRAACCRGPGCAGGQGRQRGARRQGAWRAGRARRARTGPDRRGRGGAAGRRGDRPARRAALEAEVDVVVPNLAEAEGLLDGRPDELIRAGEDAERRARAAARGLIARGARTALVTAAEAGAAVASGQGAGAEPVWLAAPPV